MNPHFTKKPFVVLPDRPTVREFKRQMTRARWERRLARTIPRYRLKLLFLLIVAVVALVWLSVRAA